MQLVEAGKVDLDQSVRTYLPWFRLADEEQAARITVRQLSTQTSGLSTLSGRKLFLSRDVAPGALERGVRSLASELLAAPPGGSIPILQCQLLDGCCRRRCRRPATFRHLHPGARLRPARHARQLYFRRHGGGRRLRHRTPPLVRISGRCSGSCLFSRRTWLGGLFDSAEDLARTTQPPF